MGRITPLGGYCDHGVAVTGIVKVGVALPQSGEFQPFAQFADREGAKRDAVFMWLNPAAVLKDEHQVGDVLTAKAVRHLPGIQHQASPPTAGYHPVRYLDDPALGMELLPVARIDHHISPGAG